MARVETSYLQHLPSDLDPTGAGTPPPDPRPTRLPSHAPVRLPSHVPVRLPNHTTEVDPPVRTEGDPSGMGHVESTYSDAESSLTDVEQPVEHPVSCFRSVTPEGERAALMATTRSALEAVDHILIEGPYDQENAEIASIHLVTAHNALQSLAEAEGCSLHPAVERLMGEYFAYVAIVGGDERLSLDPGLLGTLNHFEVPTIGGGSRHFVPGDNGVGTIDVESFPIVTDLESTITIVGEE